MRRPAAWLLLLISFVTFGPFDLRADAPSLLGFSASRAAEQVALEQRFDGVLKAENLREWMRQLTARPNHTGSPGAKANAELLLSLFRSWGYQAEIEEFWVLMPTPRERRVELLAPTKFVAGLVEDTIPEDSTSGQKAEQLPTYNIYSIDGDVTADLVYVNWGLPEDYEELAKHGISVEGKIVLAKYGRSWRGIKPKVAAEHGAVGCIIYSDPVEDGYAAGDIYPKGGWRPPSGVQRGSVKDAPLMSGDPLTPFIGATKDAPRLPLAEAKDLTRIPVLPISARDAEPLLRALGGPVAPREWRGALPFTYHLGPGPAKVRLKLAFNWDLAPAYDVIARLPGAELPDQWVIRGNHHDGWVTGATDPVSGAVAVLEEARGVAELVKAGFRPRRTIVYALWGAEEQGLLGSTEWVEHHAKELADKAVVYVNSDSNTRGFFGGGGSHTLEGLVSGAVSAVTDPQTGGSVLERSLAYGRVWGSLDEDATELRLSALGSGSDYTPFLQHLGIASLNISFGDEEEYGQYHSIYDSFDHYVRFGDPGFHYGVALAKSAGRVVLRLANADVLPIEPGRLAKYARRYTDEVIALADSMRAETEKENRRIAEGVYRLVADPTKTFVVPDPKDPVPHLNFAPLENALEDLDASVASYDKHRAARLAGDQPLTAEEAARLDRILLGLERALTSAQGLPGRPWYRHQIYAPGFYTGYGVKTLPAVREAIELRRWAEIPAAVDAVSASLKRFADDVSKAAEIWQGR
ncbi:MAG TPA: transferrin receptor-like dimerization domain-containing protein [Thermoanaerobaculia bacterium]|nr:transferrin receptor-like dimerization domain-containing protein [Thermoanaerobaculia bacterium]